MSRRHLAWTVAALLHVVLVMFGAADLPLPGRGIATAVVAQYANVSGADTHYGFFAPAVASQCRAVLTMRDAESRAWNDTLVEDPSDPFAWRTASAVDSIPRLPQKLRRALAASWAAVMFGRHPNAVQVVVDVQIEELPTMAEWRGGARSVWKSIHETEFVRKADFREPR